MGDKIQHCQLSQILSMAIHTFSNLGVFLNEEFVSQDASVNSVKSSGVLVSPVISLMTIKYSPLLDI